MQVTFIPSIQINNDLGVVNTVRVSLNKKSDWSLTEVGNQNNGILKGADQKLIAYLANNNHWTPFAHSRLYFQLYFQSPYDRIVLHTEGNMAGIAWQNCANAPLYKGSLYAWMYNLDFLPKNMQEYIVNTLVRDYPVSTAAFLPGKDFDFTYNNDCIEWSEDSVKIHRYWTVLCATLLVKVPIFVARQIRTSQVGIVYSDMYVDGESFAYNEVSRRYVSEEPKFYKVEQWRVREGNKVKQGSTGVASTKLSNMLESAQNEAINNGLSVYNVYNKKSVAPEQLRALLPQSMYTEMYVTSTLHRWAQFINLWLQPDVQKETQEYTQLIKECLKQHYPEWGKHYGFS